MKANATRDHGLDSVKEAARGLVNDASADAVELAGDLGHLKDEVVGAATQAFASARDGARQKAGDLCQGALDRGAGAAKKVGKTVSQRPLTSIAVAAAAGVLVGMYMRRRG